MPEPTKMFGGSCLPSPSQFYDRVHVLAKSLIGSLKCLKNFFCQDWSVSPKLLAKRSNVLQLINLFQKSRRFTIAMHASVCQVGRPHQGTVVKNIHFGLKSPSVIANSDVPHPEDTSESSGIGRHVLKSVTADINTVNVANSMDAVLDTRDVVILEIQSL